MIAVPSINMLQFILMEGFYLEKIQRDYLYMLKVERQYSEYTVLSYKEDLEQFNGF